jgi:diguanylate cyclase (GGDEF)-like protein/PAS domain S-box-containing protein
LHLAIAREPNNGTFSAHFAPSPPGAWTMLEHARRRTHSMRLPSFFHSLKFRIVAIVVGTGVLTAMGTANLLLGVTHSELTRVLLAADREDRERTADLLAGKLETIKLALSETARRAPPEIWRDRASMEAFMLAKTALGTMFDVLLATRPDGSGLARIVHGQPQDEMPSLADRDYFQRALREDQTVVSEALKGKVVGAPVVVIAVPVSGQGGGHVGVMAGVLRLQSTTLFAGVGARASAEGAVDLVVDRRGVLLSHPQPARLLGAAADEPGLRDVVKSWLDSGSPIDIEGRAVLSQGHLVSMAGIALSDWIHVRVTPEAAAMQPVDAARREALKVAAAAGALAALLSGALAWLMVRPISRLRARAERMLEGDGDASDWPEHEGELGAMARAFRQLLEQGQRLGDLLLQLEAVLDNAEVGIALTRDGRFEMVSRRVCQMLRCDRDQLVGESSRVIYASDSAYDELSARARPAFMKDGVFEGEVQLMRRNGELFWARMRGRAVVPGDRSRGTIWVLDDITQARQQHERLAWAANHDALTGLANRAVFERLLEQATAQAATQPFCALFIDLDRFKHVNDTGGHAAGDAMLRALAQALSGLLRKSDTLARLGGDEFGVLLPQCPPEQARRIAEKLCSAVENHALAWEGATLRVGASIGLVAVDGAHASAADVLRAADAACYAAKREGRNRVAALTA